MEDGSSISILRNEAISLPKKRGSKTDEFLKTQNFKIFQSTYPPLALPAHNETFVCIGP
jgi:hypothetical protein